MTDLGEHVDELEAQRVRDGWRWMTDTKGEDWLVPPDWPADRCLLCWRENDSHELWCSAYVRPRV